MNTASLRELSDLAANEVAGWNPKELAAAARRAVSLWRHEQPAAAARVRKMQRLQLLPLSPAAAAPPHPPQGEGAGGGAAAAADTQGGLAPATGRARARGSGSTDDPAAVPAAEGPRSGAPAAAAAAGGGAPPPEARQADGQAPARRKLSGGAFRTALVEKPLRPHELRLAQLVERLVRAANGRLAEGFGSRELSSLVWSLVSLGYWQQPLLPLVSAFADYGAERLRAADPIAMAMLLQVLAKARAASTAGQPVAGRLLELAPATAAAAAASLPRCLPSCEPRTLAGLLHSCAVLLSPPGPPAGQAPRPALSTGGAEPSATAAASGAPGRESEGTEGTEGPQPSAGPGTEVHLVGHTADALAGLARDVTRECVRRRFIGFGPAGLLTAASALTALRQAGGGSDGAGGGAGVVGSGGEEAWALLAAAAVSPLAPQMARATPQQWALLLQLAELRGGHSRQLLTEGAISAGALPDTSSGGDESGLRSVASVAR